jgi:DNA-binding SARP family transcriptional activator
MASGVSADKIGEFVHKFENEPDYLVNFLLDKLENFIVAATSQQDLAKCREDVTERDAIIAYLESEYENLYNSFVQLSDEVAKIRRKYNMIATLLKIATAIMPKDRLRAFANVATAMVLEHGGEHAATAGGVA